MNSCEGLKPDIFEVNHGMNSGPVLKVKTFKFKMVEDNVLLAYLLAHIASLIANIQINFVILETTISHFIQILESFSSRPRNAKRLGLCWLLIFLSICQNILLRAMWHVRKCSVVQFYMRVV